MDLSTDLLEDAIGTQYLQNKPYLALFRYILCSGEAGQRSLLRVSLPGPPAQCNGCGYLGHGGLDAGGVVGARAGGAVDQAGLGVLVAAHEAVVGPTCLVHTFPAVPAHRGWLLGSGGRWVRSAHQSPSGMVRAGLKQ
jgi:hypothetical protein